LSQTQHVILSIETAENEITLLGRIEALIVHLKQFPEARNIAIRAGAIRTLLKVRRKTDGVCDIQAAIREGLALLGYSDPVTGNGIRILAMDGGGIRGLLVLEMLKKLEELTGKRVHELFDLFCGVSTGAILSFSLGIHHTDLNEVAEGYKDISREVFKQSPLWGTGNLVWSQAYYDTSLWEKKLQEHLGTNSLISTSRNSNCPKVFVF
jgi:calcium-independent phospholipase A2-gamma